MPDAPTPPADHPDTLRNRIADTIRDNLKRRAPLPAPVPSDRGGGWRWGLNEYEIADVVMQKVHPELDRLYAEQDRLAAEVNRLGAKVLRVEALRDQWVGHGAPTIGTSIYRWWDARLRELTAALAGSAAPAEEQS